MKSHFFEHYDYSDDEKKDIFSNCLFVFDTNVLLNLYRYTVATRDEMFEVMRAHNDRIWIPYQVGWEFFNNKRSILDSIDKFSKDLKENLVSQKEKFMNPLMGVKHPYISVEKIEKLYSEFCASVSKKIDEWSEKDPDYIHNDVVWDTLTELFDGKVGDDFSETDLKKIFAEGKARYESKMPPGYCDLKEKKQEVERRLYGDLIVWKQTIAASKTQKKDVVFITDDVKEDWYGPARSGETKRARVELIKEFAGCTDGQRILLYNQDTFLYYIGEYLGTKVHKKAREEVKEVSLYDFNKMMSMRHLMHECRTLLGNDDNIYSRLYTTNNDSSKGIVDITNLDALSKVYDSNSLINPILSRYDNNDYLNVLHHYRQEVTGDDYINRLIKLGNLLDQKTDDEN